MSDQVVEKAPYARQVSGDGSRRQAPGVQCARELLYMVGLDSAGRNLTQTSDEARQVPAIGGDRVLRRPPFHHEMGEKPLHIGIHADFGVHPATGLRRIRP